VDGWAAAETEGNSVRASTGRQRFRPPTGRAVTAQEISARRERHGNLAGSEKNGKKRGEGDGPIVIKKYANRRLYNTATSSYVTLDHLCQMVQEDVDFVVFDAKSGEDITRAVLTQIIVEEESKGQNLLPINFLRQLISFYGDSMQWMVPSYLEHMMEAFAQNQDRMRQSMQETFGGIFPFGNLEEMGKQNMALFESALRMFAPFAAAEGRNAEGKPAGGKPDPGGSSAPADNGARESLDALKAQIDRLQKQIDTLNKDKS
jgi:polyhydroxyalkanoate synthesis repressor PhaR